MENKENDITIDKREIEKEKRRLMKIFKDIDKNKKDFVKHQIENLAYDNILINQLKENINRCGTIVSYNNGGGQCGVRDNPDVKTMIALQKNVSAITKQLVELVPPSQKKSKLDELMNE